MRNRLPLFLLCAAVGLAALLLMPYLSYLPWLQRAEHGMAKAVAHELSEGEILTHFSDEALVVRKLVHQENPPQVRWLAVTEDPEQIFEKSPPSPLDYAVILEHLRRSEAKSVGIASHLSWDENSNIELQTLSDLLSQFPSTVSSLPLRRGAQGQQAPAALKRSMIDLSQFQGNHLLLPQVNQVALPTLIDGGSNSLVGFSRLEHLPTPAGEAPLLAYWQGDGIVPSASLLFLMQLYQVSPADLDIQPGRFILLGDSGPAIPIDRFGRVLQSGKNEKLLEPVKAGDFISQTKKPSAAHWWVVVDAEEQKIVDTAAFSMEDLGALLALQQSSLVPSRGEVFPRLPLWAELVILLDVILIVCWLSTASKGTRILALLLISTLMLTLLGLVWQMTHHWTVISPLWLVCLLGLFFPVKPKLKSTPLPTSQEGDGQPIIRV